MSLTCPAVVAQAPSLCCEYVARPEQLFRLPRLGAAVMVAAAMGVPVILGVPQGPSLRLMLV